MLLGNFILINGQKLKKYSNHLVTLLLRTKKYCVMVRINVPLRRRDVRPMGQVSLRIQKTDFVSIQLMLYIRQQQDSHLTDLDSAALPHFC